MSLQQRLQDDMTSARRAQDKPRLLLLGTILSDVKNRRIELRHELTDDEVAEVLRKGIKRRRESIEMFLAARRDDLVARERGEVEALEPYLPAQVGDDEVRQAVRAAMSAGATTIGAVMGSVLPKFKGRAEGGTISAIAREELSRKE